jgi:Ca2+-binding EF-hand superfamily protein
MLILYYLILFRKRWDERKYFKKLFDDIDHNHDGEINFQELHQALKKGQENSEFDPKTVQILLQKYDQNHDNEISFDEFYSLFIGINNQFNEFLDIDEDFSGTIDSHELANALRKKSYNFSDMFYKYLTDEMSKRMHRAITFDMYVRVIARLDYLRQEYNKNNSFKNKSHGHSLFQQKNSHSNNSSTGMEHYIANSFFSNF